MSTTTRFLVGGLVAIVLVLSSAAASYAVWAVEFESKTVAPNQTNVSVAVRAYWDIRMVSFVVPVVVRSVSGGAFWVPPLPADTVGGPPVGVTWNWSNPGWAAYFEAVQPGELGCNPEGDAGYDGVSPDHFVIGAAAGGGGGDTPPEPTGRDVISLTFDVNGNAGNFEFDTACYSPAYQKLDMYDGQFYQDHGAGSGDFAFFNKGIITIGYPYPPGDVNCDGEVNPLDVVYMVNYVYKNITPFPCNPCAP